MKATDLMIGDWVRFDMSISYKNPQGNGMWVNCQVESISRPMFEGRTRNLFLKGNNFYGGYQRVLGEIEPIPLTPEILEKNGFVNNDGDFRFFKADEESYYFGFESVHYYFETHFCNVTKEFSQGGMQNQSKGIFTYVHELQHALRLCGIKKEITL